MVQCTALEMKPCWENSCCNDFCCCARIARHGIDTAECIKGDWYLERPTTHWQHLRLFTASVCYCHVGLVSGVKIGFSEEAKWEKGATASTPSARTLLEQLYSSRRSGSLDNSPLVHKLSGIIHVCTAGVSSAMRPPRTYLGNHTAQLTVHLQCHMRRRHSLTSRPRTRTAERRRLCNAPLSCYAMGCLYATNGQAADADTTACVLRMPCDCEPTIRKAESHGKRITPVGQRLNSRAFSNLERERK